MVRDLAHDQLLILSGQYSDGNKRGGIPIAYGIWKGRSKSDYARFFRNINRVSGMRLKLSTVFTDMELSFKPGST